MGHHTNVLVRQVRWLIGLRLLVAFLFLGSAAILAAREHSPFALTPLFVLVACTCFLSVLYLLLLNRIRQVRMLCGLQIWIDALLVTALVHYTGGIDSLFAFVYIFPILAAAILLSRRSSLLLAGGSSILYGVLINVQIHGFMERTQFLSTANIAHDPGYALFQTFVNSVAFFLEAILGSQLAERLKEAGRELEEQRTDLHNLRTLHQDIVENIPSGIVTLDLKGQIVSFNRTAQEIIGLTAEEIGGRNWRETPFREITQLEEFFSTPKPEFGRVSKEIEFRRKDGHTIPIGINLTLLRSSEGVLVGLVGIFQDLRERKQIEARLRQADRLAAAGQLAAGLAHEIRNPLAAISGSIQLMKEEGMGQPQLLDIVLRETDRLNLVTGQFLDFAKPRQAVKKQCDLAALAEEAFALLEKAYDGTGAVTFSLRRGAEQVMVAADPDQVKQVLWNLGLNAIQAMPGGGRLTCAILPGVSENGAGSTGLTTGEWAAVELTDTGGGISPGELDRIFEPFYTTKPGGTGLGLAIARKIIDQLEGRIEVVSRQGDGATFRVVLKRAAGEARRG
jgi:two-component system sensor histidine kinase PilS (NtrC family)